VTEAVGPVAASGAPAADGQAATPQRERRPQALWAADRRNACEDAMTVVRVSGGRDECVALWRGESSGSWSPSPSSLRALPPRRPPGRRAQTQHTRTLPPLQPALAGKKP
jgi:hypothetical protein